MVVLLRGLQGPPAARPGAPLGLKTGDTGAAKEPTGEGSGHASPETKDKNLNKETGSKCLNLAKAEAQKGQTAWRM